MHSLAHRLSVSHSKGVESLEMSKLARQLLDVCVLRVVTTHTLPEE